jgi:hypothetical protein
VNNVLERIRKEAVVALIKILSRNFPGETRENSKSVRITDGPAEVRTEHLPNTNEDRYRQANMLGHT